MYRTQLPLFVTEKIEQAEIPYEILLLFRVEKQISCIQTKRQIPEL